MKTNSFAFSTGWGLAFSAITALIINTQFLNMSAAAASDPTVPVLERTIYIEADAERQALGYEGYTLSPRTGGYRVEVVGSEKHEGTILIHTDLETHLSFVATTATDVRSIEVQVHGGALAQGWVDDDQLAVAFLHPNHGLLSWATQITNVEPSPALDVLANVLGDEQFGDEFGNYLPIGLLAILFAVFTVVVGVAGIALANYAFCQSVQAGCQQACWDPANVDCEAMASFPCLLMLPHPGPCYALRDACDNGNGDAQACLAYQQMSCAYVLQGCPDVEVN